MRHGLWKIEQMREEKKIVYRVDNKIFQSNRRFVFNLMNDVEVRNRKSEIQFRAQNHISPAAIIWSRLIAKCFFFTRALILSLFFVRVFSHQRVLAHRLVINGVAVSTITIKMKRKLMEINVIECCWKMDVIFFLLFLNK